MNDSTTMIGIAVFAGFVLAICGPVAWSVVRAKNKQ